jgi:hypothetical protein
MAEQQWEYCELFLGKITEKKKKGFLCDCYLRYNSPTGQSTLVLLATLKEAVTYNPFTRAMGLLGGAGWELVSVQYGNKSGWEINDDALIKSNRAAYFKRPVMTGRAVDEPKLSICD